MRTPPSSSPLTRARHLLRRHRRAVAAGLAALALVLIVRDARPPAPPTVAVVVAAHAVSAGSVLGVDDVRIARVPASSAPDGALHDLPLGRTVALPIRGGEVLTDVRVLGPGLLAAFGGTRVAAAVRLADAATAAVLQAGDTVDVIAAGERGGSTVAAGAVVLVGPPARSTSVFGGESNGTDGVVVLAVTASEALVVAGAAATERLSVVLRDPDSN